MPFPVIVVDDNRVDRYLVRRRIARHPDLGLLREVADGARFLAELPAALAEAAAGWDRPLLVLMDINMPGMTGFETVEALEALDSGGPPVGEMAVVMYSSSGNPADHARARALGLVRGYVQKPLAAADLPALVADCRRMADGGRKRTRAEPGSSPTGRCMR